MEEIKAMKVGELKKIIENVPDEYVLIISLEGMNIVDVTVDDENEVVDFSYL